MQGEGRIFLFHNWGSCSHIIPQPCQAARMWRLDLKSHDPLCTAYFHIYYCSISQMTGFPIRASECMGPFHFMPLDRHVELHTWVIYRQVAGGNGRFTVAFLKVMNKGYREADFLPPERLGIIPATNLVPLTTALSEDIVKWGMFLTKLAESFSNTLLAQAGGESRTQTPLYIHTSSLYPKYPVPPNQLTSVLASWGPDGSL